MALNVWQYPAQRRWPTREELAYHPAWSIDQYESWGVPWPRKPGWKRALIEQDERFFDQWYSELGFEMRPRGRRPMPQPAPSDSLKPNKRNQLMRLNPADLRLYASSIVLSVLASIAVVLLYFASKD